MSEILSYIAGVMDSDGYFSIRKSTNRLRNHGDVVSPQYFIRVGLKQVESEAVDLIHSLFGGSRTTTAPSAKNGKRLNVWQATDRKARRMVGSGYMRMSIWTDGVECALSETLGIAQNRSRRWIPST